MKKTAEARTIPLPLTDSVQQLQLSLGFYLERQYPARPPKPKVVPMSPTVDVQFESAKCDPKTGKPYRWVNGVDADKATEYVANHLAKHQTDKAEIVKAAPPAHPPMCQRRETRAGSAKKADAKAKPSDARGKKKAPPGHVWWVSESWTDLYFTYCNVYSGSRAATIIGPGEVEFIFEGMQLESANGALGMTRGAQYAFANRESKRREKALVGTLAHAQRFKGWPVLVTLTRIAPCRVDDDNLGTMFKRIRDGICEALGFRDDAKRAGYLDWKIEQETGGSRADKKRGVKAVHHVRVRIEVMK